MLSAEPDLHVPF